MGVGFKMLGLGCSGSSFGFGLRLQQAGSRVSRASMAMNTLITTCMGVSQN